MKSTISVFALLLPLVATASTSAVTVTLPHLVVARETTEVTGIVTITGGTENVLGMEFYLLVAGGGPDLPGSPPNQPIVPIAVSQMTSLFSGSVFSAVGANELVPFPQNALSEVFPGEFQIAGVQTIVERDQPIASINGADLPLLKFTLKLHDASPGTYSLAASRTLNLNTVMVDDSSDDANVENLEIINGSITVVPEPRAWTMAWTGLPFYYLALRRRRT